MVADALSRKVHCNVLITSQVAEMEEPEPSLHVQPIVLINNLEVHSVLRDEIIEAQKKDKGIACIRRNIEEGKAKCFRQDKQCILWFNDRLVVPKNLELRRKILDEAHQSKYSVHPGSNKMYQDLRRIFGGLG